MFERFFVMYILAIVLPSTKSGRTFASHTLAALSSTLAAIARASKWLRAQVAFQCAVEQGSILNIATCHGTTAMGDHSKMTVIIYCILAGAISKHHIQLRILMDCDFGMLQSARTSAPTITNSFDMVLDREREREREGEKNNEK